MYGQSRNALVLQHMRTVAHVVGRQPGLGVKIDEVAYNPQDKREAEDFTQYLYGCSWKLTGTEEDTVEWEWLPDGTTGSYRVRYSWFVHELASFRIELMRLFGYSPVHGVLGDVPHASYKVAGRNVEEQLQDLEAIRRQNLYMNGWVPLQACKSSYGEFVYLVLPGNIGPGATALKPRVNVRDA